MKKIILILILLFSIVFVFPTATILEVIPNNQDIVVDTNETERVNLLVLENQSIWDKILNFVNFTYINETYHNQSYIDDLKIDYADTTDINDTNLVNKLNDSINTNYHLKSSMYNKSEIDTIISEEATNLTNNDIFRVAYLNDNFFESFDAGQTKRITIEGENFDLKTELVGSSDYQIELIEVEPTKIVYRVKAPSFEKNSETFSLSSHEQWGNSKTITFETKEVNNNLFISTWDTTNITSGSSNSNQITLPLESSGTYNFIVDWGDGTSDTITQYNQAEVTHTYLNEGIYEIKINGTITGFRFNNLGDRNKLLDISNYGSLNLGNNGGYFYGAENFQISATDTLDLSGTLRFSEIFRGAKSFNSNIENWDTSQVQFMNGAFLDAQSFNQPLNNWDTSSLWFIRDIFRGATSFNQDLDNWDVSRVTDFALIFFGAHNFNGDISTWDTSKATSFYQTFRDAYKFNSSINDWDTSNVETMFYMFRLAKSFDQPLDKWDTSSVVDMAYVFEGAHNFSQDLGSWDTSSVTNMGGMFIDARVNFDASNWDTSSVTNMAHMFKGVSEFNQDLESWDTSSVTNMAGMFAYTSFNGNIATWDTSKVTDFGGMFHAAGIFNQDLSNWDISSVVNCNGFDSWTSSSWLRTSKPNFDSSCFQYG